jgi:hypothetical protein
MDYNMKIEDVVYDCVAYALDQVQTSGIEVLRCRTTEADDLQQAYDDYFLYQEHVMGLILAAIDTLRGVK